MEITMKTNMRFVYIFVFFVFATGSVFADSVYELRKLSEDDWLSMSTEERLNALATSISHVPNQTFLGDFGYNYDLYKRWGYDFYEMEDRYENYSFRDFTAYNIVENRRLHWSYNEFGDRISKMQATYNVWSERYLGDNTFWALPTSDFINAMAPGGLDGVWVAQEATDDWAVSINAARAMRKHFTSLTFSMPNLQAVTADFQSATTEVSLITSALLSQTNMWREENEPELHHLVKKGGVMLRGGNIRRKFGALTLGATYVNQYAVQGNREGSDDWFGTVSTYSPTPIYVMLRFLDDSPNDKEGGPVIYETMLQVDGVDRPDIIPTIYADDTLLDKTTAMTTPRYSTYLTPSAIAYAANPTLDHMNTDFDIGIVPKFVDYLSYSEAVRGYDASGISDEMNIGGVQNYFREIEMGSEPLRVSGTEVIVFMWDMMSVTSNVERVRAVVRVSNDYLIQSSFMFTERESGGHDTGSDLLSYYSSRYWRNVAQAEGNIKDESNLTTVQVDFGYQVASLNYGVNAQFNYLGFKVSGEFVTNENHFMYSDGVPGTGNPTYNIHGLSPRKGHQYTERDNAYYVIAQKDWEMAGLTGEVFKMGKFYRPYLDYHAPEKYGVTTARMQGEIAPRNYTLRMPLIQDNDDNDHYADTDYMMRNIGFKLWSFQDPDGVFPGNDEDNDGLPDNNRNNNEVPDYYEAFLMFDAIPDEFVFGDDLNNNTIPDFRENDFKFDTPYDFDRQGYHYTARFSPQEDISLVVGTMHQTGVGRDWRTNNDYFKAILNYDIQSVGTISAEYRYQRINDNIADPYVQVDISQGTWLELGKGSTRTRFQRQIFADVLEYRNSKVNRLYIESNLRPLTSIIIENLVKYESNAQIEGTMYDGIYQADDVLTTYSMINKLVYTKRLGNFSFSPGINLRFYKKSRENNLQPMEHYLITIPLIMLKYDISPITDIQLGFQGVPGFEFSDRDYVSSSNDYKRRTYLLQIENRSVYFGYDIWTGLGFKVDWVKFDTDSRSFENYKTSSTFLNVGLGW
jgi:hypothetical protein